MRLILAACCLATPAWAWEFTPGLPCVLRQDDGAAQVELTHDPTGPLFTITIVKPVPWPEGDVFSIRFDGARPLTISTNRHVLSQGGRALTVMDTGFGNVLDGMEFNAVATATVGGAEIPVSLEGAAQPVAAFRACRVDPTA